MATRPRRRQWGAVRLAPFGGLGLGLGRGLGLGLGLGLGGLGLGRDLGLGLRGGLGDGLGRLVALLGPAFASKALANSKL